MSVRSFDKLLRLINVSSFCFIVAFIQLELKLIRNMDLAVRAFLKLLVTVFKIELNNRINSKKS